MNLIQQFTEHLREDTDLPDFTPPTYRIVCPQCDGRGSSTAYLGDVTNIIAEDPDFGEDYWAGHYDRECDLCHGRNVVEEMDEDRLSPEIKAMWLAWCEEEIEYRQICEMERRMGA